MKGDSNNVLGREQLRTMLIENATEINRLTRRIHETVKRRSESEALRLEWSDDSGILIWPSMAV
jgi:hypothetical protein